MTNCGLLLLVVEELGEERRKSLLKELILNFSSMVSPRRLQCFLFSILFPIQRESSLYFDGFNTTNNYFLTEENLKANDLHVALLGYL